MQDSTTDGRNSSARQVANRRTSVIAYTRSALRPDDHSIELFRAMYADHDHFLDIGGAARTCHQSDALVDDRLVAKSGHRAGEIGDKPRSMDEDQIDRRDEA